MSILKTIENCITSIPTELVNNGIFYVELSEEMTTLLRQDLNNMIASGTKVTVNAKKVEDVGECLSVNLSYLGYNIIVAINKKAEKLTKDFYIAFKTKIL